MNFWRSRTALALGLTVAALVVPCGAWYIVGSREVRRDNSTPPSSRYAPPDQESFFPTVYLEERQQI